MKPFLSSGRKKDGPICSFRDTTTNSLLKQTNVVSVRENHVPIKRIAFRLPNKAICHKIVMFDYNGKCLCSIFHREGSEMRENLALRNIANSIFQTDLSPIGQMRETDGFLHNPFLFFPH